MKVYAQQVKIKKIPILNKTSFIKFLIIVLFTFHLFSCKKKLDTSDIELKTDILRIITYDNFIICGIANNIAAEFEKMYDCTIIFEIVGEGSELLNNIIERKDTITADIVIGIDNNFINKALSTNIFLANEPDNLKNIIDKSLLIDKRFRLIPYNYNYYAFLYDNEIVSTPPKTFGEIQNAVWRDKIILVDPNSSSVGYGLILWSLGIWGERGFEQYWERVYKNVSSVQPSLSDAYFAFVTGEAPIMFSYVTSSSYINEQEKTSRYSTFIPEEGNYRMIEFAGIIHGAKNLYLARRFMEFMLTPSFQKHVATSQWMFPIINEVQIPSGFINITIPKKDLSEKINSKPNNFSEKWIESWSKIMIK